MKHVARGLTETGEQALSPTGGPIQLHTHVPDAGDRCRRWATEVFGSFSDVMRVEVTTPDGEVVLTVNREDR